MTPSSLRVAVLVPCFNEEAAVATVVADFRKNLPAAAIYVYDNNSSDRTAAVAREAGAEVRSGCRQRAAHDRYAGIGSSRYGGRLSRRSGRGGLPAGPSHRQLDADQLSVLGVRPGVQ